jgi:hypothetical protein
MKPQASSEKDLKAFKDFDFKTLTLTLCGGFSRHTL